MIYYLLLGDNVTREYAMSLAELRKKAFRWLAFQKGNMEMKISIFCEDGMIAEQDYLNYAAGNRCYLFFCRLTGPVARTFRSYHPMEAELAPYLLFDEPKDIDWIEIPTLKGKQVCMTGGLL